MTERLFFASSSSEDGSIHQVNLFKQKEDKFARSGLEAVGGAGVADIIRIDGEGQGEAGHKLTVKFSVCQLVPPIYHCTFQPGQGV